MKQISELSTKLQAYESAAHQTSSTNQKTSSAHTNSAHPNTTTNQNASPAPQDNDPTCLAALQLKSKTEEIERLNTELKKRTFNLQELVNTELWQKNREIEKLLRKSEKKAADLSVLRASLKEKESHLLYLQKEMSEMVAEINATQVILRNILLLMGQLGQSFSVVLGNLLVNIRHKLPHPFEGK